MDNLQRAGIFSAGRRDAGASLIPDDGGSVDGATGRVLMQSPVAIEHFAAHGVPEATIEPLCPGASGNVRVGVLMFRQIRTWTDTVEAR